MDFNALWAVHTVTSFFSAAQCGEIVEKACAMNAWTRNRHKNYPTTDIPLSDIKGLNIQSEIDQLSTLCMHQYGLQGTARAFDLFVVKYEVGGQDHLDLHRDASELSFVALLSDPSDFDGGGTYYESLDRTVLCGRGDVVFHCGKMRHAGKKITRGKRFILIGFFDVSSPDIRKPPKDMSNALSDRRYLDFLYRHNVTAGVRIYIKIINLLFRREKLESIMKRIESLDIPPSWSVDVQVIVADEGKHGKPYLGWQTSETYGCSNEVTKYWRRPVKQGEIGCFVSHLRAIRSCRLDANEYLLVLEDDADFSSDLLYRIDHCLAGDAWDCIDLGGMSMDGKCSELSRYHWQRGFVYQAHCILYNSKAVEKLSGQDFNGRIVTPDEFFPAIRGVHPRPDMQKLYDDVECLDVVFPYERMSTQVAGVHDTESDTPREVEQLLDFERVGDDHDMRNYYIFRTFSADNVSDMIRVSNTNMWRFQLHGVKSGHVESGRWNLCVSRCNKIVCILLKEKACLEFQHSKVRVGGPACVVFPSYLSFKCDGRQASCYYGIGSSFF